MTDCETYTSQMLFMCEGYPLYNPDPEDLYDFVRIGDVGHIEDGRFLRGFNVSYPANDPVNYRGVPHNFIPYEYPHNDHKSYRRTPLFPGPRYMTRVGRGKMTVAKPGRRRGITTTKTTYFREAYGVALILKHFAYREDALPRRGLYLYMMKNYPSWLTFFRETLKEDVQLSDLTLVVGCDLTADSSTAMFHKKSMDPNIQFNVPNPLADSPDASIWGPARPAHPRSDLDQDDIEDVSKKFNQCVFIRSYRLKDRSPKLPPLPTSAGPSRRETDDSDFTVVAHQQRSTSSGVVGRASTSLQVAFGPTPKKTVHEMIADYLLQKTKADIALIDDDDIWKIFTWETLNSDDPERYIAKRHPPIRLQYEEKLNLTIARIDTNNDRDYNIVAKVLLSLVYRCFPRAMIETI